MAEEELRILKRFKLDPDTSVLIQKYSCMYHGGKIPVFGSLFIMNDNICYSSKINNKTIIGKKTKVKIAVKDIILCEILNNFGTGILITTQDGQNHQFNNLGNDAQMANYLITDMMEGYLYKLKQQSQVDQQLIQQIENDMENSAIRNSLIDQKQDSQEEKKELNNDQNKLNGRKQSDQLNKSDQEEEKVQQNHDHQNQQNQLQQFDSYNIDQYQQEQIQQQVHDDIDLLKINPQKYEEQLSDDFIYCQNNPEINALFTKKWDNQIYEKTYVNMPAAQLSQTIFISKNEDDKSFVEFLSDFMEKNDEKIKQIQARIDPFSDGQDSLDDILVHSNYALTTFYEGSLDINVTRGTKQRTVHVKTTLHKPIALIKVFPYTEVQKFYVVSPRKIIMHSKLQMQKVFYSDHYYVDLFWDLDEQFIDNQVQTTVRISCSLIFNKKIPLVQKKIQDYYDQNMVNSFNKYLKPQLEQWIENQIVDQLKQKSQNQVEMPVPQIQQQNIIGHNFARVDQIQQNKQQQNGQIRQQVSVEELFGNFMKELRAQAGNQIPEQQLDKIIKQQLDEAKGKVLTQLIVDGVDVDLCNQNINPDSNSIEGCNIF
eukprot:403365451